MLTQNQLAALRLIASCGIRGKLTENGNRIVSCEAKELRELGMIIEARNRWVGYKLTDKGSEAIA